MNAWPRPRIAKAAPRTRATTTAIVMSDRVFMARELTGARLNAR